MCLKQSLLSSDLSQNKQHCSSSSHQTRSVAMAAIYSTDFFWFSFRATSLLSLNMDFAKVIFLSLINPQYVGVTESISTCLHKYCFHHRPLSKPQYSSTKLSIRFWYTGFNERTLYRGVLISDHSN